MKNGAGFGLRAPGSGLRALTGPKPEVRSHPQPPAVLPCSVLDGAVSDSRTRMDFQLNAAQRELSARARALADEVFRDRAARWDTNEEYPRDNVTDLVSAGLMGLTDS